MAAEWAGIEVAGMVEWDSFCQAVLRKHWSDMKILGDIHEVTGREFGAIDIIYGGYPCQPFSVAGKRKGSGDDRFLWPEMFRIIREVHPRWILAENVPGLVSIENGMVFEQVCADLESENYQVQAFIIGAVAVNAPHRRDRVWIVAHRKDADGPRVMQIPNRKSRIGTEGISNRGCNRGDAPDAEGTELKGSRRTRSRRERPSDNGWDTPWIEVATRLCRVDDGLPRRVDRVNRLKALGNSIVPQCAFPILEAIAKIEREKA